MSQFQDLSKLIGLDSLVFPDRPEGRFANFLERCQKLIYANQEEFGAGTIATKEFGEVSIRRTYGFASISFEVGYDLKNLQRLDGKVAYVMEVTPEAIRLFYRPNTICFDSPSPEQVKALERIITALEPYAEAQKKVRHHGFRELHEMDNLTPAQQVAWGLDHALKRIQFASDLLVGVPTKGPLNEDVERAARIVGEVGKDLRAMKEYLPKIVPKHYNEADFDSSIVELDSTSVNLVGAEPDRRDHVLRIASRALRSVALKISHHKEATAAHRSEPILAA